MKIEIKFSIVKNEGYDLPLLEKTLLKSFEEVDYRMELLKTGERIQRIGTFQKQFLDVVISVEANHLNHQTATGSVFIALEELSLELAGFNIEWK